jgi:CBS domain-containing protein
MVARQEDARRVGEVMQRDVITIPPRTPLREVLRLLHEHGISGAPVVDDSGTVRGVVSVRDVLGFLVHELEIPMGRVGWELADEADLGEYDDGGDGEEAPYHRAFEEGFRFTGLSDPTAGDRLDPHAVESVMTPSAFSVRSTDPVSEAAAFMMRGRIHRALVVDDGRLVGIVTPFDLLRLLATEHSRAATV